MVVVASLDDPQVGAGAWERARTASAAARRERTAAVTWTRDRTGTWARDSSAAPFARVD